jgi:hypothetical protein
MMGAPLMEPQRIAPDEVKHRVDRGEPVVFLDTRSAERGERQVTVEPIAHKAETIVEAAENLRHAEGDPDAPD